MPVAVSEHDLWLFEAEGYLAMVGYIVDKDRSIRLVALVDPGGEGHDGVAASLLGNVRNVKAFMPRPTEAPNTTMYLGEVLGRDLPKRAPGDLFASQPIAGAPLCMSDCDDFGHFAIHAKEHDVRKPTQHLRSVRPIRAPQGGRQWRLEDLVERAIGGRDQLHAETGTLRLVPESGLGQLLFRLGQNTQLHA